MHYTIRNLQKTCTNCGRTFNAIDPKKCFCSDVCKKAYSNHISYRCRDCRNVSCTARNNSLVNSPLKCSNLIHTGLYSNF